MVITCQFPQSNPDAADRQTQEEEEAAWRAKLSEEAGWEAQELAGDRYGFHNGLFAVNDFLSHTVVCLDCCKVTDYTLIFFLFK